MSVPGYLKAMVKIKVITAMRFGILRPRLPVAHLVKVAGDQRVKTVLNQVGFFGHRDGCRHSPSLAQR